MGIKYEAVFGDQSLFDNAIGDSVAAINHGDVVFCFNSYNAFLIEVMKCNDLPLSELPVFAMRRIIRTPTWNIADQKAGKLPEVGCKVFDKINENEVIVKAINARQVCLELIDGFIYLLPPNYIDPIESPEEKAARLRSEWCNRAMDYSTIQQLYNAMLSGDLPVPVAPEQNK